MSEWWSASATLAKWGMRWLCDVPFVYVTIPVAANLVAATVWSKRRHLPIRSCRNLLVFAPILTYPLIALAGGIAWFSGVPVPPLERPPRNQLASDLVEVLNIMGLVVGVLMIVKMKGMRWYSASAFACVQWVLAGINFMAAMPIAGVWL
jgi:hypothetical protein